MDLFTYLMAKNDHNSSVHGDLFSYLLGKGQSQTQTISGVTIYIPNAKKLVNFMMTKESTQDNIAYVNVGSWEQGNINSYSGVNETSNETIRTKDYIKVYPNILYSISRTIANSYMGFRFYDENKNYLGNQATSGMVSTNKSENRMVVNDYSMTMTILNTNVSYMRMTDNSNNLNTIYTISTESTPSPDYPQEVKTVKGYRNLFDGILEQGSFNTNSGELTDDIRRVRTTNYIEVNNEQYYFNMEDYSNYQIVIYVYDMNENYIKSESNTNWLDFPYIKSFDGQRKIKFGIRKQSNTAISVNEPQKVVMFLNNQNVNELPYVPYGNNYIAVNISDGTNTNQVPLPLNGNEIVGIGDYKDELIVDKSGHVWLNKLTIKKIFDGSEEWNVGTGGGNTRFFTSIDNSLETTGRHEILSNYFRYSRSTNDLGIGFIVSGNIYFYPTDTTMTTTNQFKNWLNQHNTVAYYQAQIPQPIDLNTTVDLKLFKGVNNITNSEDGYMTIEYK